MRNSDTVIKIEGLSKKFCYSLKRSMYYGAVDIARNMLGISYDTGKLRPKEFWALKDINLELKRGETLGLIGANGCGKTTLLRLIAGIFPIDKGKITVKGRLGSLIAVGAGFHPHMTGRENIYLNGTILGMTKKEISKRFHKIVEFAEIGKFLDAPVSTYSSGMTVRLGFSIAIHCDPDIMLVDEVLAVGDVNFQRKCLDRISRLRKEGLSIILVSHNMQNIEAMCSKVMLLDQGSLIKIGRAGEVISHFELMQMSKRSKPKKKSMKLLRKEKEENKKELGLVFKYQEFGTNEINLDRIYLLDSSGNKKLDFLSDESFSIVAEVSTKRDLSNINLWNSFIYLNPNEKDTNLVCMSARKKLNLKKGKSIIKLDFGKVMLTTGNYKISFNFFDETFSNPYSQGHYGFFTARKDIPTKLRVGRGTPMCWREPRLEITKE